MTPNRRDFIKGLGITLAAAMLSRCTPGDSITTPGPTTAGPTSAAPPTPKPNQSARERLRACWQRFGWLDELSQDWDHQEKSEQAQVDLTQEHRAALDALVAAGALAAEVADLIQLAYNAAVYHVWRSRAPITCYEPVIVDYKPTSSGELVWQAQLLAEVAAGGEVDPATVELARETIERDMAFLNMSGVEVQALYDEILQGFHESNQGIPDFADLELPVSPEEADAAGFLIELLLEE